MNPMRYGAELRLDHPLVGTRWASNNGHFPLRVVMAVCESVDDGLHPNLRQHALLTNNIPGMKTWRKLDANGDVSGHHQIAEADPAVAWLSGAFESLSGVNPSAIAQALRYPNYDQLPGPGSSNPKACVTIYAAGLRQIAERIRTLEQVIEQNAIATFDNPLAGYAPEQPAEARLAELEARLADLDPEASVEEGGVSREVDRLGNVERREYIERRECPECGADIIAQHHLPDCSRPRPERVEYVRADLDPEAA